MRATFDKLQELEYKAKKSIHRSKKYSQWLEGTVGTNYRRRWGKMIIELRGWEDYKLKEKTKPEWLDYCKKNRLDADYNFGDILA